MCMLTSSNLSDAFAVPWGLIRLEATDLGADIVETNV
jgi:hypothetical protein